MQTKQTPEISTLSIGWIHIMRVSATFIVVMAHVDGWGGNPFWASTFYYVLSRIGVPIFFLISGYLLLSKEESIIDFLKKRFARVAIPFLVWSIIYDIVSSGSFLETGITFDAVLSLFIRIIRGPRGGHLWFMYFLIGLYLLTPILRVFVSKAQRNELLYYIGLWFLVTPILDLIEALTPIQNGFEVYNAGGYLGYFLLGYYLGKLKGSPQTLKISWVLFITGFIFTFAIFYYNIPPENNELAFRSYTSLNIIVMSMAAFLLIKSAAEKAPPLLVKIAQYGGIASFGIYLIHLLILNRLSSLWVSLGYELGAGSSIIIIPVVASITFILSWIAVYIIQKIPLIRSIV